jgi:hypothetical protein
MPVLMNKMEVQAIELAVIVGKLIDLLLLNTPVEIRLPVGNEILHIGELCAVLPFGTLYFVGPARVLQPFAQVTEHFICDMNVIWSYFYVPCLLCLSVYLRPARGELSILSRSILECHLKRLLAFCFQEPHFTRLSLQAGVKKTTSAEGLSSRSS